MELGKAKYGTGKKVFKIQDGDNVFRILPPMGKLAKSGKWHQYYRVEWGYKNSANKNRPFLDVRVVNFDTKMVEVESAAHLRREALKAKSTELVAALRKDPQNATLKQQYMDVKEAVKRYNLDSKYYLNAIDLNGQIGLLKIGSRAFKALRVEIDKLMKTGVDPLSVENGRFFNFNRSNATGNFQDTAYQVTVYKERVNVNGEMYDKDKIHKLDDSIISRLSAEAFELSGMYPAVTPAQVEAMVKGGAVAVDQILGAGNSHASADDEEVSEEMTNSVAGLSQAQAAPLVEEVSTPVETASVVETAPVETAPTTPVVEAAPTTSESSTMSTDDFLRSIGAL